MTIEIRQLRPEDIAFANELRAIAGWNQTLQDWERFLLLDPKGCFVAEFEGVPAGTAALTCYGTDLAWIGMLLVHPHVRRHGIGSALLQHCLQALAQRQVRCVKLDATPLGQGLYTRSGFVAEVALARWEAQRVPKLKPLGKRAAAPYSEGDLEAIVALDRLAFGTGRREFLRKLIEQSTCIVARARGQLQGFGIVRPGSRAHYLGPVVASSGMVGQSIIQALLRPLIGQPVYWDIFDVNAEAIALAERLNFQIQRPLVRMARGACPVRPQLEWQLAIADPAVG